jgi:hypothetical protein
MWASLIGPPCWRSTIIELETCWIRAWLRPGAPLSLVTGADSSHFLSLMQFLASVAEHEPDILVRAYDLGLHPHERDELERTFSRYVLPRFDYDSHPPHVNIRKGAGRYAWKPIIVWNALVETAGPVCWMDAGNMLTGRLDGVRSALCQRGFYSITSRGTAAEWTHPAMLTYFGLDAVWAAGKRNLSGSCVGFHPQSLRALRLARRWRNGALIKKCIAPPGSNRSNHRQDQSLLTVLAHMRGFGDAILPKRDGFVGHQDIDQNWRHRVAELDRREAEIARRDNGAGTIGVRGR